MKDLVEVFEIFLKYDPNLPLGGAEHDIIFGPMGYDIELSPEDQVRLSELGWFISSEFECWATFV
jgi:hypothetical protein